MSYRIVPIAEEHIDSFRDALGSVAAERRYLAAFEAPPEDMAREFVLGNIKDGNPQFVAIEKGQVVGWCDVVPKKRPVYRHAGVLGMGVIASHRGRGIGSKLLDTTLKTAWAKGLTRIELIVRADNEPAKALYRRFGFVREGICRNDMLVDGSYYDAHLMALLATD